MKVVNVVVEGHTEQVFVETVLQPYTLQRNVHLISMIVKTGNCGPTRQHLKKPFHMMHLRTRLTAGSNFSRPFPGARCSPWNMPSPLDWANSVGEAQIGWVQRVLWLRLSSLAQAINRGVAACFQLRPQPLGGFPTIG